jgi:hypothetical protein
MVPKSRAEAPNAGGGDSVFPEGSWIGEIEKVEIKALPFTPGPGQGYLTPEDIEITSIWFGANASADGEGECGQRKFFFDLVTRDGTVMIEGGPDIPKDAWQLQRSAAFLANLAAALGATEEVTYQDELYVTTTEGFLEQLQAGDLNGSRVGYEVKHREWVSKRSKNADGTAKKGVSAELQEFFQAV